MATVMKKKYRTFARGGVWSDPLFDYDISTTYHFDDNAEEFDTVSESVDSVLSDSKYEIPALPKTGTLINIGELYTHDGQVYRVRQSHKVTAYNPDDIPALFTVYRKETDDMAWIDGEKVDVGAIRLYKDKKYTCIQAHQTQSDWTPPATPTLWEVYSEEPVNEVSEWVQPTGAHDAYQIGDQVLFNGSTYESVINANVWSPTVYPAGWCEI